MTSPKFSQLLYFLSVSQQNPQGAPTLCLFSLPNTNIMLTS